jgi:hypothetical protein
MGNIASEILIGKLCVAATFRKGRQFFGKTSGEE